jgi:glycosyltransferase involved in cell wall biosynthesis
MKKVLIVSNKNLNEPGGRVEKFRTRKNILEDHGWRVIIQKVDTNLFSVPKSAYQCYKIIKQQDIDIINSVNNPPQLHIVGLLAHILTNKPWLVEYRDPLANNPELNPNSLSNKLRKVLERIILYRADQVVWGNGIQLNQGYFDKFSWIDTDKITKLPFLGFKEELFHGSTPNENEKFTLTYAGSFYENLIEPHSLLKGISEYSKNYSKDIRMRFYGDWNEEYQKMVDSMGLNDIVETNEFIPHEDIIPILEESNICVHIGGTDPKNRLSVPSKIWDYMGAGRPILAVVDPEFRVAKFLQDNNLGIPVHPDDTTGIAAAIDKIRSNRYDHAEYKKISEEFTREKKMKKLVQVLNDMT